MAINYEKVPWTTSSYVNPTNMNRLENGVKSACDGVDTINSTMATSTEVLDLKMLGWTVPKELGISNYVSNGVYHQKVGRVCLGDLTWGYSESNKRFSAILPSNTLTYTVAKAYCSKYSYNVSTYYDSSSVYGVFCVNNSYIYVRDSNYTSSVTFKTSLANTFLYYELATEITRNLDGNEIYNETDSLKMLGWTCPVGMPIKNYTDSKGVFHQKVGRVCLGDLTWSAGGVSGVFGTTLASAKSGLNAYMNGYTVVATISHESQPNMSIQIRSGGVIYIKNTSYTDATAFRTAMANQQVYLYYELATEVTKNVDGNEAVAKLNDSIGGLTFTVSGNNLVISNGTKSWTLS